MLTNQKRFILAEHLVIVEYFTTWCTQCPKTVPWLEELEQKYEHAIFLRVSKIFIPLHTPPLIDVTTPAASVAILVETILGT